MSSLLQILEVSPAFSSALCEAAKKDGERSVDHENQKTFSIRLVHTHPAVPLAQTKEKSSHGCKRRLDFSSTLSRSESRRSSISASQRSPCRMRTLLNGSMRVRNPSDVMKSIRVSCPRVTANAAQRSRQDTFEVGKA